MTYHKIETLYERDSDFKVIPGSFKRREFGYINDWVITEKIDGMNIRLCFTRSEPGFLDSFSIKGRSDNSQIPEQLATTLREWFEKHGGDAIALMDDFDLTTLTLCGEGYGPKIQNGGGYAPEQRFVLFDVSVNGRWLDIGQVEETASLLGLEEVPRLYFGNLNAIEVLCREGFSSRLAGDVQAEGVVARTRTPLYDRRGNRLIWKLKTRDFRGNA